MTREHYRGQVDWISVQMVQRWREQIDQRAQALPTSVIQIQGAPLLPTPLLGSGSPSVDSSADPSEFQWLTEKLKSNTRMELADIKKCVQLLIKDGIDSESILADLSPDEFTIEYLKSIGIISLGARQQLLRIHQSLVKQHGIQAPSSQNAGPTTTDNKIVHPADARKMAALEKEMLDKTKAANETAQKAVKTAAETKSMLDAFVEATGVGAGGQMQDAVRTKDGEIKITMTSPATEQRLDTLGSSVAVIREEHEQQIQDHDERLARLERRNNKNKCCTVS
jgi:hypothetical protein